MRTYLADIIPKIKRYSEKLNNLTLLTNQHWVVIDELENSKFVYIFRSNFELLISQNGKIEKGKWEYLGNNSLLIERKDESYLFRHGFFDADILALKVDGKDEFAFLVNENNYVSDLNSIEKVLEFLERKYLKMIPNSQNNKIRNAIFDSNSNKTITIKDLLPQYSIHFINDTEVKNNITESIYIQKGKLESGIEGIFKFILVRGYLGINLKCIFTVGETTQFSENMDVGPLEDSIELSYIHWRQIIESLKSKVDQYYMDLIMNPKLDK